MKINVIKTFFLKLKIAEILDSNLHADLDMYHKKWRWAD